MAMTLIEKILADHSGSDTLKPGDIADIYLDVRAARDFGGANVVRKLSENSLAISDPSRTFFTFDCNPTGSDQKYAVNQHICRQFARENGIKVYDIDAGIGTHILLDEGLVGPGSTAISTDSHANILGAVGAFGQGMGDLDIASGWSSGKIWFKVPESVKIIFRGDCPPEVSAKDIVLNMLALFGANSLLGYSVELYGPAAEKMSLDQRITVSSMATEMGAIIILFPPSDEIISFCNNRAGKPFTPLYADADANYREVIELDISSFRPMISRPGAPHDAVPLSELYGKKIDSAFIGSCTNGRMEDLMAAAEVLRIRKVAPGVVLKIVPATDRLWKEALSNGVIEVFKNAGALVSNAGCAGCAAGQVGQNGPGEITISTGNRNFPGKQGKGSVYLASPEVVAASAVAGFITGPGMIPEKPALFISPEAREKEPAAAGGRRIGRETRPDIIQGRIWYIDRDNIDTDMIFHNRYLSITDINEMGRYTFDNLQGFEDFAKNARPGDIVVAGKNFGSGSSRQQAVDCFISLGISAIVAESFGAIYERNAINAAFPVVTCNIIAGLEPGNGDVFEISFLNGEIKNKSNGKKVQAEPFSKVQYGIYQNGGLI